MRVECLGGGVWGVRDVCAARARTKCGRARTRLPRGEPALNFWQKLGKKHVDDRGLKSQV